MDWAQFRYSSGMTGVRQRGRLSLLLRLALDLLLATRCALTSDRVGSSGSCDIETVDGAALSAKEFGDRYVRGSRPVRLTGLADSWSGATATWGKDQAAIARMFGDAPLVSRWAEGSYLFGLLLRPVTMARYLSSMVHPRSGLLFNSSRVGEGKLWTVPPIIADAGLTETVISVGPPGGGLGFHNHGSTFEAIVSGGPKRFALLPPIAAEVIDAAGDFWGSDVFKRLLLPAAAHRDGELLSQLDALGIGQLQTCTVSPGEAIYIPCNWYHATENLPQQAQSELPPAPPPGLSCGVEGGTIGVGTHPAMPSPTIAIAMQWTDSSTRKDTGSNGAPPGHTVADYCPADVHADFRQLFQHAVRMAGAGQTAQATQLLEKVCSYTPIFVHCTVGVSRLYRALGRAEDAQKRLLDGVSQYTALKEAGVIDTDVLVAVLSQVASEMDDNLLNASGSPSLGEVWSAYEAAAKADVDGLDPALQMRWARILLGVSRSFGPATQNNAKHQRQPPILAPPVSRTHRAAIHEEAWPAEMRTQGANAAIAKARRVVEGLGVTSFYYQPPTTKSFDSAALTQALARTERELAGSTGWRWWTQLWYKWLQ